MNIISLLIFALCPLADIIPAPINLPVRIRLLLQKLKWAIMS